MKTKLSIIAILLATVVLNGLTISPVAGLIKSGDISFGYSHPLYGTLDGIIKAKTGQIYGVVTEERFGRFLTSLEALYITVPIESVVVGGMPKNWGNKAEGWSAVASVGYIMPLFGEWVVVPTVGIGYQDILGGGGVADVGIDLKYEVGENRIFSVGISRRYCQDTEYQGITMRKEPSTIVKAQIGWRF